MAVALELQEHRHRAGNEFMEAGTIVVKLRSSYTWLDKLRFLKGLPPMQELACINPSHRKRHGEDGCRSAECMANEEVGAGNVGVQERVTVLHANGGDRNSKGGSGGGGGWAMEECGDQAFSVDLETRSSPDGSDAKPLKAEQVVWTVSSHTGGRRELTTALCSCCAHHDVSAVGCEDGGSLKEADRLVKNGVQGQKTGTVESQQQGVFQCFDLDVFGMEENRLLSSAKEKGSRKSRKLCFLPKSADQISKEVKQPTAPGYFTAEKQSRLVHQKLQSSGFQDRSAHGLARDTVSESHGATNEEAWALEPAGPSAREMLTSKASTKATILQRLGAVRKQNNRSTRAKGASRTDPSKASAARNRRTKSDHVVEDTGNQDKVETGVVAREQNQHRSGSKRKLSSMENDTALGNDHFQSTPEIEQGPDHSSKKQTTPVLELASDHPSMKPIDSLVYITYQVFLKAGRGGLTAREAASRIEESGLGGIFQGLVKPRIKIGKIIRNNPYYLLAGEGRYVLCEAIVGVTHGAGTSAPDKPSPAIVDPRKEAAASARREGTARYWQHMKDTGRTRVSKGRHVKLGARRPKMPSVYYNGEESFRTMTGTDELQKWEERHGKNEVGEGLVQAHTKPRLKGMYKTTVGGKPCKRSDGKNWQCPLLAPSNSNYCEHHQKRMKDAAEV